MNYREELKNILMRVRGDTIAFGVYMGAEDEALEEAAKQLLVEFGKSLNKAEKLIQEARAGYVQEKIKQFTLLYGRFDSDTGKLLGYKTNEFGTDPCYILIDFLTKENL